MEKKTESEVAMKFILVFFAIFVSDCVWTLYISAVAKSKPVMASIFSGLTVLLGMVATIVVVNEPKYIVPAVLGAVLGTYLMMKWSER
jgi:Na+-translocating ferredoxin:NAD+ oxidoreductase RnfE subunit